MRILVTGGAGFIGSQIVDSLVEKDYEVSVLDNLSTGNKKNINKDAKFYEEDITSNIESVFKKEKPEIVIHSAAQVMLRKSLEEPLFDAKTNILGTINILEECVKNKVGKIIYTSTGGARVGEPKYLPVDEDHPINPCSPYGISKHTSEHYVETYGKIHNMDYLIFCFGNVYGQRDDPLSKRVIPLFTTKMLAKEIPVIFGDGEQTRDFIYASDLSEFTVNSINKNPKHKLFHLANGTQVSINKVFEKLKDLTGFKGDPEYVKGVKGEVRDICLDVSLARTELGWQPKTSLEKGLENTVNYFREEGI